MTEDHGAGEPPKKRAKLKGGIEDVVLIDCDTAIMLKQEPGLEPTNLTRSEDVSLDCFPPQYSLYPLYKDTSPQPPEKVIIELDQIEQAQSTKSGATGLEMTSEVATVNSSGCRKSELEICNERNEKLIRNHFEAAQLPAPSIQFCTRIVVEGKVIEETKWSPDSGDTKRQLLSAVCKRIEAKEDLLKTPIYILDHKGDRIDSKAATAKKKRRKATKPANSSRDVGDTLLAGLIRSRRPRRKLVQKYPYEQLEKWTDRMKVSFRVSCTCPQSLNIFLGEWFTLF